MLDVAKPLDNSRVPGLDHSGGNGGAWSPPLAVRASAAWHGGALLGLAARPDLWALWGGAVLVNHALLGLFGMMPRNGLLGDNLVRLPEPCARSGLVALCFDDGPDPAVTPAVLRMLEKAGATASFFCVGQRARAHPSVVRDIVRAGHSVENHTDRHPLGFAALGTRSMRREVARAQATLAGLAGVEPRFFRGPAGLRSPLLDPVLARCGLRYVTWTRRGRDTLGRNPRRVLARMTAGLEAGDILLLHDRAYARTAQGMPMVLAVLPDLLAEMAAHGLSPVSLPRAFAFEAEAASV